MNYEEMSDFEINKMVAIELAPDGWLGINQSPRSDSEIVITTDNGPSCTKNDYRDYCNNPSDAWPVVLEHGISMMFDMSEDSSSAWWNAFDISDMFRTQYHANPLRAAMIVFLMMKDAECQKP